MAMCPKLAHLDLRGNPVCAQPDYRSATKAAVATLKILDENPFFDAEVASSLSSSEYQSSPATSLSDAKACSSKEFVELTRVTSNKLRIGPAATNEVGAAASEGWAPRSQSAGKVTQYGPDH